MTMTKLDWLKLITINKIKKTRIEQYGLPLPSLPSPFVPGEKQESSKPEKTEILGIGESRVVGYRLRLKSRGGLLQNVESEYKEGF